MLEEVQLHIEGGILPSYEDVPTPVEGSDIRRPGAVHFVVSVLVINLCGELLAFGVRSANDLLFPP